MYRSGISRTEILLYFIAGKLILFCIFRFLLGLLFPNADPYTLDGIGAAGVIFLLFLR